MRYWVFTEEQLEAALDAWQARRRAAGELPSGIERERITEFLRSPEAVEHKLQGGASYEPNRDQ